MMEPLFGSSAPTMWAAPLAGIGYQAPMTVGNGPLSPQLFGSRPAVPPPSPTPAATYPQTPNLNAGFVFPVDPSAVLIGVRNEAVTGMVSAPSLLTAVALRRGQPQGPATDQEVEDFIYDALDLLPGAADVEVRCESGRVTLTGSVQQKRVKRDVGEVAWAIPAIQDVQNNVTIASRRRTRPAASREADVATAASGRKQG